MLKKAIFPFAGNVKKITWLLKKNAETFNSAALKPKQIKAGWATLTLVFLVCILFSFAIIAGSRVNVVILSSSGNIEVDGVGVYDDMNCHVSKTYLDWGKLSPGSSNNVTVYIRNEGDHVATLFLSTDNWTPTNASNYIELVWNYDGRMLSSMEVIEVTLTLSVSSNVENAGIFSFDIIIGTN